jgi:membrane-associated phospholipid phosphatase
MKRSHLLFSLLVLGIAEANAQSAPGAASWPTWAIPDVGAFVVPPPPSATATRSEAEDLKIFANLRGEAVTDSVRFWDAGAPPYRWIQIAQQEVSNHNLGGPAATRAMSLVAVAMNDATLVAWNAKSVHQRPRPAQFDPTIVPLIDTPNSPSYPSEHAVVAASAAAVLGYLFPDRKSDLDAMASTAGYSRLYAGTEFPSDVNAGMALGGAVAGAVIDRAKKDGSDMVFSGSFPPAPGRWSSPAPSFPLAGLWKPWALGSGSEVRLAAPPAFDSAEMKAQVEEVKTFERTTQRNRIALFWQPSFIDPWIDTINQMIFERHIDRNPPLAASIYAMAMVAQHDATIACWDTKYAYLEPRPIQVDPTIQTQFATPAHPSFPSGHACASGAAAGVLAVAFPETAAQVTARALEAGLSTFYAGIHYRNDVDQGLALGEAVAKKVLAKAHLSPPSDGTAPKAQ